MDNEKIVENKSGDNSLRDWFGKSRSSDGKPGWVQLGGKYAGKPCAKQPGQTTKPKCVSFYLNRTWVLWSDLVVLHRVYLRIYHRVEPNQASHH